MRMGRERKLPGRGKQERELIQTCVRERYDSPVLCIEIAQRVGLWGQKAVLEGLLRPVEDAVHLLV